MRIEPRVQVLLLALSFILGCPPSSDGGSSSSSSSGGAGDSSSLGGATSTTVASSGAATSGSLPGSGTSLASSSSGTATSKDSSGLSGPDSGSGGNSSSAEMWIEVQPTELSVLAGGMPVWLDAVVHNGTGEVQWTLEGPGSLSITSGISTKYFPPGSVTQSVQALVRATLQGTSSSASATITIQPGTTTTVNVQAAAGGNVTVGDASLSIPAGALDRDADITLVLGSTPVVPPEDLLMPVGPTLLVDLGGAVLLSPAMISVPFVSSGTDDEGLVLEEIIPPDLDNPEDLVGSRLHGATRVGDVLQWPITMPGTFLVRWIPPAPELPNYPPDATRPDFPALQLPFYWQAGQGWCNPSALAMYLNFFEYPLDTFGNPAVPNGLLSNYYIAGVARQDACRGSNNVRVLQALAVPASTWKAWSWDADLIPNNPFTRYIRAWLAGGTIGSTYYPPRPVATASDRNVHIFVINGMDSTRFYIHDSNNRWPVSNPPGAPFQPISEFRSMNCMPGTTPGVDCAGNTNTELRTVVFYGQPRPERNRRASIELAPAGAPAPDTGGSCGTGNTEYQEGSLTFRSPTGAERAWWKWDGTPYTRGYYFTDGTATPLTDDSEFGVLIPRTFSLRLKFNVVNVTGVAESLRVVTRLFNVGVDGMHTQETPVSVAPYSRQRVEMDLGSLTDVVGMNTEVRRVGLFVDLFEGSELQDTKLVEFKVEPAGNSAPVVRIVSPAQNAQVVLGQSVAFLASATDAEDGDLCCQFTWSPAPSGSVQTGPSVEYVFNTLGDQQVMVTATDSGGASASATRNVTVISPPPRAVLSQPMNGEHVVQGASLVLSGYGTDYSGATTLPCSALAWSVSGVPNTFRNGVTTGCDTEVTFSDTGSAAITLTVTDAQSNHGTYTVYVNVDPFNGNNPPAVRITLPLAPGPSAQQQYYLATQPIDVAGEVSDVEDGMDLPFSWTATGLASDGSAYSSPMFLNSDNMFTWTPNSTPSVLSQTHCQGGVGQAVRLTAQVTDSGGAVGSASVIIRVACTPE